ncbi:hypothetical protein SNOG_03851 [Parastagonospora nodorum SN15]|uniref:Uncharacterized protein n=1 Tax=Phaeosphaeria nodorum (strain SN15 / ATCC MYA-4574 / FGSC 10173) TaxID=321614 RepID=Q0UWL3_PHANO|nr:hypothetical protein SNOG_03851 [Parastagonospora nodorum SN15]EAT89056.1 hypothetical protein SNOG_03851 [Parastagonospora nodorum SN15]
MGAMHADIDMAYQVSEGGKSDATSDGQDVLIVSV